MQKNNFKYPPQYMTTYISNAIYFGNQIIDKAGLW